MRCLYTYVCIMAIASMTLCGGATSPPETSIVFILVDDLGESGVAFNNPGMFNTQ